MEGYLIRIRDLVVHAEVGKWDRTTRFNFFYFDDENRFEQFRRKHPYANCIKYDLEDQLFSDKLKKTMKKKLKLKVLELKEVKSILRDINIEKIINE